MADEQFCKNCNQRHNCGEIYEQLGNKQGPSVFGKAILVFLVPIAVFIAALVIFQKIFTQWINSAHAVTALACLLAAAVSFVGILLIRLAMKSNIGGASPTLRCVDEK